MRAGEACTRLRVTDKTTRKRKTETRIRTRTRTRVLCERSLSLSEYFLIY